MRLSKAITEKIARVRAGDSPRVLDLFSGCGGISLGFHRAGYEIAGAIESDRHAAQSHGDNFFRAGMQGERQWHHLAVDITKIDPMDYVSAAGMRGRAAQAFDVIVGGPPCQAFARVGRAKLREVAEHPEAFRLDPRASLYLRYLQYVRELKPLAILMENVPDVLNYGGHNIAQEVCETLDDLGYECRYTLLNAVHYGVPEFRERMFLIGLHRGLGAQPKFPAMTHAYRLPQGYDNTRRSLLKKTGGDLFTSTGYFIDPQSVTAVGPAPTAVTAQEAIGDLPVITAHLNQSTTRSTGRPAENIPYHSRAERGSYADEMRVWPGFEGNGVVSDHVTRQLPRDYPIFRRMAPGDEYPAAQAHALDLFNEALQMQGPFSPRSAAYRTLKKRTVPPYDPGKFPNKWRKMAADEPARTLMAHLGKDCYSHIHYDSDQARTITLREAARLQSFPDGFQFAGTLNSVFRQIGNAVPPLLAYRLGESLRRSLSE